MNTNDNTQAALLAALTAIVAECMDYPLESKSIIFRCRPVGRYIS